MRRCRKCAEDREASEFDTVVDGDMTFVESVCRACKADELASRAAKPTRKEIALPIAARTEQFVSLRPKHRDAVKAAMLSHKDVPDAEKLLSSPCAYSGECPALGIDYFDGTPVPAAFPVKAAKGKLAPATFAALCRSMTAGHKLDTQRARSAMGIAARYDAVRKQGFEVMCAAVSENFDDERFQALSKSKR